MVDHQNQNHSAEEEDNGSYYYENDTSFFPFSTNNKEQQSNYTTNSRNTNDILEDNNNVNRDDSVRSGSRLSSGILISVAESNLQLENALLYKEVSSLKQQQQRLQRRASQILVLVLLLFFGVGQRICNTAKNSAIAIHQEPSSCTRNSTTAAATTSMDRRILLPTAIATNSSSFFYEIGSTQPAVVEEPMNSIFGIPQASKLSSLAPLCGGSNHFDVPRMLPYSRSSTLLGGITIPTSAFFFLTIMNNSNNSNNNTTTALMTTVVIFPTNLWPVAHDDGRI